MYKVRKKPGEPANIEKLLIRAFIALAVIISLFPFYMMFISATNSNAEILNIPPTLMFGKHLIENWGILNSKININRVFLNSIFVSLTYTGLTLILSSAAGYALSKYDFKGKNFIFGLILITIMLPGQVMYVPLFQMMNNFGWANSYKAVIFPDLANAFGLFLMRQNMISFPDSLIEAARIDGYGELSIFFKIVMPNMKPALGALGIYMFMSSWNNFMWPLIILSTKNMYTFPVALSELSRKLFKACDCSFLVLLIFVDSPIFLHKMLDKSVKF